MTTKQIHLIIPIEQFWKWTDKKTQASKKLGKTLTMKDFIIGKVEGEC